MNGDMTGTGGTGHPLRGMSCPVPHVPLGQRGTNVPLVPQLGANVAPKSTAKTEDPVCIKPDKGTPTDDGRVAEIFINLSGRAGGEAKALARDAAIAASLGLQHGIRPGELRHSLMRDSNGGASGVFSAVLHVLATEDRSEVA